MSTQTTQRAFATRRIAVRLFGEADDRRGTRRSADDGDGGGDDHGFGDVVDAGREEDGVSAGIDCGLEGEGVRGGKGKGSGADGERGEEGWEEKKQSSHGAGIIA